MPLNAKDQSLLLPYRSSFVPIAPNKKAPIIFGWSSIDYFPDEDFRHGGVGLRGDTVVTVDVDDALTGSLLRVVLPQAAINGRESAPLSHFCVHVPCEAPRLSAADAEAAGFSRANYPNISNDGDSAYWLELKYHRGLQACVPPTIHPESNERLKWLRPDLPIPEMTATELESVVRDAWFARSVCCLWTEGVRHKLCLALGAWLRKSGYSLEYMQRLISLLDMGVGVGEEFARVLLRPWNDSHLVLEDLAGVSAMRDLCADLGYPTWVTRVQHLIPALRTNGDVKPRIDTDYGVKLAYCVKNWVLLRMGVGGVVYDRAMGKSLGSVRIVRTAEARWYRMDYTGRGAGRRVSVVDDWLESEELLIADSVASLPGEPWAQIVALDGGSSVVVNTFLRGPLWRAAEQLWELCGEQQGGGGGGGGVGWWLDWCARVYPVTREREIMHDWIARLIGAPWEPRRWALLCVTPVNTEGVGRSSMWDVIGRLLGSRNVTTVDAAVMRDKWTDWAAGRVLRICNETHEIGSYRKTISNRLKSLITDDEIAVVEKREKHRTERNYGGYVLLMNDTSDIDVGEMSRRFCGITCGIEPAQGKEVDAFQRFARDETAIVALGAWYYARFASGASLAATARPPATGMMAQIKEDGKSGMHTHVVEIADSLGRVFTFSQFVEAAYGFGGGSNHLQTVSKAADALRSTGYKKVKRIRIKGKRELIYCRAEHFVAVRDTENNKIIEEIMSETNVLYFPINKKNAD